MVTPSNERMQVLIVAAASDRLHARKLRNKLNVYRLPQKLLEQSKSQGKEVLQSRAHISFDYILDKDGQSLIASVDLVVVVCSPSANNSPEVDDWIRACLMHNPALKVLPYVIAGEPYATVRGQSESIEALPKAIRFSLNVDGQFTDDQKEPLAADAREEGDGARKAWLKLLGGIYGIRFEKLEQRFIKRQRRNRILLMLAAMTLLLIPGLMGWRAFEEDRVKKNKELHSQISEAFAGLNLGQGHRWKKARTAAERLIARGVNAPELLSLLKLREAHSFPPVFKPVGDEKIAFILTDKMTSVAVSLRQSQLWLFTNQRNHVKQYKLHDHIDYIADKWRTNEDALGLLSWQLIDNKFWYVVGNRKTWVLAVLNIENGALSHYPRVNGQIQGQFNNLAYELHFQNYRSLSSGWVLNKVEDTLYLEHVPANKRYAIPNKLSYTRGSYWFSASKLRIGFIAQNTCTLLLWSVETGKIEERQYCDQKINSMYSDKDFSRLFVNYGNNKGAVNKDSSWVIDLDTQDKILIPGVSIIKQLNRRAGIFTGSLQSTFQDSVLKLDLQNGKTIWATGQQRWYHGLPSQSHYSYTMNEDGELIRLSNATGKVLLIVPTECENGGLFSDDEVLHCLSKDGYWLSYSLGNFSYQRSAGISQVSMQLIPDKVGIHVLGNSDSKGIIAHYHKEGTNLVRGKSALFDDICLDRGLVLSDAELLISAYVGNYSAFSGCALKSTAQLILNASSYDRIASGINHPSLATLMTPFPKTFNWYIDRGESSWVYDANGLVPLKAFPKLVVDTKNHVIIGIAVHPKSEQAIVHILTDDKYSQLWLWNMREAGPTEKLQESAIDKDKRNLLYRYGYSPDGHWLYWYLPNNEHPIINWRSIEPSEKMSLLPRNVNSLTTIRFDEKGTNLLLTDFSKMQYQLIDVRTGRLLWQGGATVELEIHRRFDFIRYREQTYDLRDGGKPIVFNYPGNIHAYRFHPEKAWLAASCDGSACIVDLRSKEVIFLAKSPEKATQAVFSTDNKALFYVLDNNTLVEHTLEE